MVAGRARSRRGQQELFRPVVVFGHGGRRKGAGRKPKGVRSCEAHKARPTIKATQGLHVVMRVAREVGNLRRPAMYRAIQAASRCAAVRGRIRILHISIQRTHVHMIVEAENNEVLGRGMQGFQISAARRINTVLGDGTKRRRGAVFVDRYHLVMLTSPTQARHALSYVLNNWRKHGEDRDAGRMLIDWFSSGCSFPDWQEHEHEEIVWRLPRDYVPLVVCRPRSWLLELGWKLAGTISARAVPSQRP